MAEVALVVQQVALALKELLLFLGLLLVCMVRAVLPASVLPKKTIAGEIVLVTGAGSGLGRALALRFSKLGARLVLVDINETGNAETAALLKGEVHCFKCDLSDRTQICQIAERVRKEVGEVDILINNAGIVTGKKFLECNDAMITKTMELNVMAHFWTTKAFLPSMLERNHGHIVGVASGAGLVGTSGLCDYSASKFAAVGFNESLYMELQTLKKTGVQVTTVCPFYMDTGMFDGVTTKMPLLLPILKVDYAADKIVDAVLLNQQLLYMPRALYILAAVKAIVPVPVGIKLAEFFGVNQSMDAFRGRAKSD